MTMFKAEHHAMLFAWLAQEATSRFGEDGKAAILDGVRRYGEQRGGRMAERARADGHPNDVLGFLLYGELPLAETTNEMNLTHRTPHVEVHAARCDWCDAWRERDVLESGRLYCQEIDYALMRGFNPDFRFEVDGTMSGGAPVCRFIYHDGRLGVLDMIRYLWLKRRIKVTRPMEFHAADLYRVISETLIERFGESGREVVDVAMAVFAAEYGSDAAEAVRVQATSL